MWDEARPWPSGEGAAYGMRRCAGPELCASKGPPGTAGAGFGWGSNLNAAWCWVIIWAFARSANGRERCLTRGSAAIVARCRGPTVLKRGYDTKRCMRSSILSAVRGVDLGCALCNAHRGERPGAQIARRGAGYSSRRGSQGPLWRDAWCLAISWHGGGVQCRTYDVSLRREISMARGVIPVLG